MRRPLPTLLLATTTIAVATTSGLARPVAAQGFTPRTELAARSSASGPFVADGGGTNRGDLARDGWYSAEPGLNPATVESPGFRQLFSTSVSGQVYAQPILDDGVVLVGTEEDWIYGLNPVTGAIEWKRQVGNYFPDASLGCGDLTPNLGITSTPTVDPATGIAYFVDQQYLSGTSGPTAFFMHAINPANGAEEPHFPVEIQGSASNDPSESFVTDMQNQRAGLLLLGGVLYAAFSSHCDNGPYWGFVVGVSTAGRQTTMWSDEANTSLPPDSNSGGGIWQTGTGLVSDGPNQILLAIGNGPNSPSGKIPGSTPPANLGESAVRLAVKPNGSLKATDFFTPTDAANLDANDLDFGTGGPILLPPQFGTPKYPHLLVAGGKEGYLYLLNRDNLGGVGNGPGGTDAALAKVATAAGSAPYPMLFGSAAVWPGNGSYIYVPTSNSYGSGPLETFSVGATGAGVPTLTLATPASSAPTIGYASASPIVTSDGTTPGSGVVWVVSTGSGPGNSDGVLEAFAAVPANGTLQLLRSWPIGTATKFNGPGVGGDRLYVGTQAGAGGQDGHVLGFGEPATTALSGAAVTFPATRTGSTATATLVVTARQPAVTVTALSSGSAQFVATTTPALPVTLNQGGQLKIAVTFTPTASGKQTSGLTLYTSAGQVTFPTSGTGLTMQQFDVGGYRLATSSGSVSSLGDTLPSWCPGWSAVPTDPVINAAATPDGAGCWLTTQHGAVIAAGDAHFFGSEAGKPLKSPIVGFATTADGLGYWLVAADGGIFGFGDARFYGSTGGIHLKRPIVGMAATPTGHGYWLVASDGGIFAFGDARFYGSTGGIHLKSPIVGMAATPNGSGYWFVASDGGIFGFGGARFLGSEGSDHLTSPVIGMASTGAGEGYWLAQANGSVKAFGDALYEGSAVIRAPESVVAVIRP